MRSVSKALRAVIFLFSLLLAASSDCGSYCNDIDYPSSVVFTVVVFRHGDRAPDQTEVYACDPYQSEKRFWPEGYGNLLKTGRQRLYTLGKFLRHRYEGLLPPVYHFRDINVTSSEKDRTITSAQCILAGLYLPQPYDNDDSADIVAPVIPVHVLSRNNDNLIMFKKNCPAYAADLDRVRVEQYEKTLAKGMAPVYSFLSKVTCQNISNIVDANRIHTDLIIQAIQGYEHPAWVNSPEYPAQQMEYIGAVSFAVRAWTHRQKRLAGGPFLTKLVDSFHAKLNGTLEPDYKMILFSGHDTTVSVILKTLGYEKALKPDFGSSILFELHRIEGHYFVHVLFKPSGFTNEIVPVQFPECHLPSMCTLDEFESICQHWRISSDEWEKECTAKS